LFAAGHARSQRVDEDMVFRHQAGDFRGASVVDGAHEGVGDGG